MVVDTSAIFALVDTDDEHLHRAGQVALLAALRRRPSLVDWVSFEMMREQEIDSAFAFDRDFVDQGFAVVP